MLESGARVRFLLIGLCIFVTMNGIQYVTDSKGKPTYVQLPIKAYEKLLKDAGKEARLADNQKAKRNLSKYVIHLEATAE